MFFLASIWLRILVIFYVGFKGNRFHHWTYVLIFPGGEKANGFFLGIVSIHSLARGYVTQNPQRLSEEDMVPRGSNSMFLAVFSALKQPGFETGSQRPKKGVECFGVGSSIESRSQEPAMMIRVRPSYRMYILLFASLLSHW